MKSIDQNGRAIKLLPNIVRLEIARVEMEPEEGPGLENIDVPGLDLETVLKMLPQSDEEHYVGSEYFVG
jgi:hypothetical protein